MARKRIYIVFIWLQSILGLWAATTVVAQNQQVKKLDEIIIKEKRLSEFAIGARMTNIDSSIMLANESESLANLLVNYSATHIKSHGNGMLSSISFRGTGAEHTAVLWHGVNISYPMLGQSDFSLLPIALNDQVNIQHGTGSSLFGTGALGGTISLENSIPNHGLRASITQWLGSFGTIKNTSNFSYANDIFFIKLNSYWDRSTNDFSFRNTSKIGEPIESQQNASFAMLGFGLESGVRVGTNSQLLVSTQLFSADRELQPSMNGIGLVDNQDDKNIRIRTRYQFNGISTDWHLQYAYLDDEISYNRATTKSHQHVFRGQINQRFSNKIKASIAADHNLIDVSAQFYTGQGVSEYRTNLWASILLTPKPWISITGNIRQAFHPVFTAPLSPSVGMEVFLGGSKSTTHTISAMFARGFRIPTLNELYWEPGGNLNLLPEDSYSAEMGYKGKVTEKNKICYEITAYRMWVNNWILWRPTGNFWSPQNIREVDVYGVELSGEMNQTIGRISLNWHGNYAYTKSINRTGLDQFDRSVGKQLSYTPIHKGGLTMTSSLNTWSLLINGLVIGERFITGDNEVALPAYVMLNLRATKSFNLDAFGLSLYTSINNILNTDYQSVANKAMPGINYLIGINLNFNKPE